jgi:enamine deaminase RidA (YjgF/YER057c/UK114 family)
MNEVYVTFFPNRRPARTALAAGGIPGNGRVEIECIATVD